MNLDDYIPSLSPDELTKAIDEGIADSSTEQLIKKEAAVIRAYRRRNGRPARVTHRTGLSLSGGGIRSAAFSLGVMQALAAKDILKRIDYLSSVSGGSYTAASLSWFLSSKANFDFGVSAADFPYGIDIQDPADRKPENEQAALLNFIRQHGAYLTPGHGITFVSAVATVLRGIVLNLLVWFPILVAVMGGLLALPEFLDQNSGPMKNSPAAFHIFLYAALCLGVVFIFACLVYSFSTFFRRMSNSGFYLKHRLFESKVYLLLYWIIAFGTLASLPFLADISLGWFGQFGGAAFFAAGVCIGIWSFFRPENSWVVGFVRRRALPFGALLCLYGVLLFAYQTSTWIFRHDESLLVWEFALGMSGMAVLSGWVVNINFISMQRYYRDRLMEAFMPDLDRALTQKGGPAPAADTQPLSAIIDPSAPVGPYLIINSSLPLSSSRNRRRRLRSGDSFILSPLYCGSSATGWRGTGSFMKNGLTLPTAAAISGTVSHRRRGMGGIGFARNPLVSMLMTILNLRMGYWIPNPRSSDQARRPNHFHPGLQEAFGWGRHEHSSFLLLEDGGYFDNLGLYELVRRRLRLILVCDAVADSGVPLADFYRVLRRIREDFGARVTFDHDEDFHGVIPSRSADFPEDANLSDRCYFFGTIHYSGGETGTLIYLKSTLVAELDFEQYGYGSIRPDFPEETTVDQFFDEEQFEAHRRLGYALAHRMIQGTDFEERIRRLDQMESELGQGSDLEEASS